MKKLSNEQIEEIKLARADKVSCKTLAERYSVSAARISQIAPQSTRKPKDISEAQPEPAEAPQAV